MNELWLQKSSRPAKPLIAGQRLRGGLCVSAIAKSRRAGERFVPQTVVPMNGFNPAQDMIFGMVRRQYDADRGIRRSFYYDGLSAVERDELIVKLHNRGLSQSQIAKRLGNITQQGISKALKRIAAGRTGAGPRG